VALDTANVFSDATIVATPQGWLRSFSPGGIARQAPRRALDLPLESFAAMVLSLDDLDGDLDIAHEISLRLPTLVLTRGRDGCSVYRGGRALAVPAFSVTAVDTIGAGDVFAAAFFVCRSETGDDVESARFASAAAAVFLESSSVSRIPSRRAIADRLLGGSLCTE
jgi:sugar/nucleoside kinase (ribokinase family)